MMRHRDMLDAVRHTLVEIVPHIRFLNIINTRSAVRNYETNATRRWEIIKDVRNRNYNSVYKHVVHCDLKLLDITITGDDLLFLQTVVIDILNVKVYPDLLKWILRFSEYDYIFESTIKCNATHNLILINEIISSVHLEKMRYVLIGNVQWNRDAFLYYVKKIVHLWKFSSTSIVNLIDITALVRLHVRQSDVTCLDFVPDRLKDQIRVDPTQMILAVSLGIATHVELYPIFIKEYPKLLTASPLFAKTYYKLIESNNLVSEELAWETLLDFHKENKLLSIENLFTVQFDKLADVMLGLPNEEGIGDGVFREVMNELSSDYFPKLFKEGVSSDTYLIVGRILFIWLTHWKSIGPLKCAECIPEYVWKAYMSPKLVKEANTYELDYLTQEFHFWLASKPIFFNKLLGKIDIGNKIIGCDIDVDKWKMHTTYRNVSKSQIDVLFEAIGKLSSSDQKRWWQFCTGRRTVPKEGLGSLEPKLIVAGNPEFTENHLFVASTCLHQLTIGTHDMSVETCTEKIQTSMYSMIFNLE